MLLTLGTLPAIDFANPAIFIIYCLGVLSAGTLSFYFFEIPMKYKLAYQRRIR